MTVPLLPAVLVAADAPGPARGFNWVGLVVIVVLGAVAWPAYRRLRDGISRRRHERWAEEEGWDRRFTPDNDPDLKPRSDDNGTTSDAEPSSPSKDTSGRPGDVGRGPRRPGGGILR